MVTIATIVTSFLLKILHYSNSDFNDSDQKLYGATLTKRVNQMRGNHWND